MGGGLNSDSTTRPGPELTDREEPPPPPIRRTARSRRVIGPAFLPGFWDRIADVDEVTDEQLLRLIALSQAATPGPWERFTEHEDPEVPDDPADTGEWESIRPSRSRNVVLASEMEVADAEFIVAARELLPVLAAELLRLRAGG